MLYYFFILFCKALLMGYPNRYYRAKKTQSDIPTVNRFVIFFRGAVKEFVLPMNTVSYIRRETEGFRFLKTCDNRS